MLNTSKANNKKNRLTYVDVVATSLSCGFAYFLVPKLNLQFVFLGFESKFSFSYDIILSLWFTLVTNMGKSNSIR